jgi:hypothetical protein
LWCTAAWGDPFVRRYQFCAILGAEACRAALIPHWDTWVTQVSGSVAGDAAVQPTAAIPPSQSDLATLAAAGVTHVRIPVGYWIMGPQFLLPGDTYQVSDGGGGGGDGVG